MYSPNISKADIQQAKYLKKYDNSPLIRQRMQVIYLRGIGMKPGACAQAAGVHRNSVTRWVKVYMESGLEQLQQHAAYRPQSNLVIHRGKIKEDFERHAPRSIKEACHRIHQLTGLKRGPTQVRHFIKRVLKYRYRKYKPLPGGKKSIEDLALIQAGFVQNTLQPLLDKASRGAAEVFFMDAAHPVMGFHTGQAWSEKPLYVRTSSGRHRMNILGAMQAISKEVFSITTPDYIKATTVVEMIKFLREELPGKRVHVVLDNARYQRCGLVAKAAKKHRVHLVFLPPYSPNLNLIERFWKLLKKQVLAGVHYPGKEAFFKAVNQFIDQVNDGLFDDQIRSIMKLDFQTLKAA